MVGKVRCWDTLTGNSISVILTSTVALTASFISNGTLGSVALLLYESDRAEAVASVIDSFMFTLGNRCQVEELLMSEAF